MSTVLSARPVPRSLSRTSGLVWPDLQRTMGRLHPTLSTVAQYHKGWLDAAGRPTAAGGGKALRATLALLSARAAGAPAEHGVPAAIAVELLHDFSLLHDDVMDGDTERRHRPTAWTVFGTSSAILTGDALLVAAFDVLLATGRPAAAAAAGSLATATAQLITGQGADMDFERRVDVTLDECLAMIDGKTGALIRCACALGARLAGAPAELVQGLAEVGTRLGLAFQMVDDLLGIWGDPAVTGKPALGDLRSRKKSVPVLAALGSGMPAADDLAGYYTRTGEPTDADLPVMAELIERCGGRRFTERRSRVELRAAERRLDELAMPPDVRTEFVELARYVVERDR